MHTDSENLSYGLCVVCPFGNFDWENGAELLLLEPGIILQLRPGDALFFPSATITHGNFPLSSKPNQTRYSFMCYSTASLFQWDQNGGKLSKDTPNPAVADWEGGWGFYRKVSELKQNGDGTEIFIDIPIDCGCEA